MQAFKRFRLTPEERGKVLREITAFLDNEEAILFAYVYGSFCGEDGFNDIDVAVYVNETAITKDDRLDYQLGLAVRLERALKQYSIDSRILNNAPLSFRFSVITHGDLICAKDEKVRVSFEAMTRSLYFDFKPHAQFYYQHLVVGA